MQTPTNKSRMIKIATILDEYYEDIPESNVIDLLADLRHYCWYEDIDIDRAIETSEMHFNSESEGE